ncbi:SDR family NAD(P)-dependent oxidoreductase [Paenibacillus hunanensis]|uniref:NAD(P)-dependent dehydrogenase (Short-subunit alcohol dehydrogenase family) n=1 Tax=Paenibacillus hunanensis TaxID=539262 RepID=A0ABU1IYB6_9BACL|nr:SDR family NAD(P)-dependent oxidoreductase [Paenibacillus hunanensis]MCL9661882.1 SDR family oxidoreductase [Paenibacillus hunanensis]MDR6244245.1 NAD(P)-dependent dehydrogenase (short-subunit alcohol dehydrogenase family) [Paenibacillus hunanensis]GGJ18342.1 short chain dehydrogenase [Paenibacillus hunanensis]
MDTTQNKVAIITGGASGLGLATALKLAEAGVNSTIVDISEQAGLAAVAQLEAKGVKALFVRADVSKAEDVKRYVDETVATFGKIDMFFNNAGISGPGTKFADNTIEQIEQVIGINLLGGLYGLKYVLEVMLQNGGGAIVNTSSTAGLVGQATVGSYSATKHGLIGITKTIAVEYAAQNIRINAIAPGTTETPMVKQYRQDNPETFQAVEAAIPQRRLGQPEEIADLVAFLLSERASYINGVVVPIDGGFTAQ